MEYMMKNGKREEEIRFEVGIIWGMVLGGEEGVKIDENLEIGEEIGREEMMMMGYDEERIEEW